MEKVKNFINETVAEMRYKVSWPTYPELQKSSMLVLIGSLVFAAIVGVIDFAFDKSLTLFYNQF